MAYTHCHESPCILDLTPGQTRGKARQGKARRGNESGDTGDYPVRGNPEVGLVYFANVFGGGGTSSENEKPPCPENNRASLDRLL